MAFCCRNLTLNWHCNKRLFKEIVVDLSRVHHHRKLSTTALPVGGNLLTSQLRNNKYPTETNFHTLSTLERTSSINTPRTFSSSCPRTFSSSCPRTFSSSCCKSAEDKVYTHFGYEQVEEDEKTNKVYNVFENVAETYDVMNDAMSFGTHRLWKTKFVEQLNIRPGLKVLDMAGGTGDIAFKMFDDFTTRYPKGSTNVYPDITISDINASMLEVGKQRAEKLGIGDLFQWVQADAESLPFEDESLDLYTIAFGIRNVTHVEKALDEAYRVLKVGGRLSCLEFSHVDNPLIGELYDQYSFQVIPVMGQVLANDWDSYQYLVESIRKFPRQEVFADMIYEAGFSNVRYEELTFGVCSIHDGFKI